MRAVVFAYHNIGCAGIEALERHGFEIQAVFTHTDDPAENKWFRSVAELAARRRLPVFAPEDVNHPIWVERIRGMKPDLLFSFYYRKLLRRGILEIPPLGCLNLHGSLLPRYRGRAPLNWVLVNGEQESGVTLHYMTPRPDEGDIVAQESFPISDDDTAHSLHQKALEKASVLLDRTLPRILDGTAPRTPQDPAQASYFGGRSPEDGEIDWNCENRGVRNLVRAVTRPYPGAFSHLGERKILVWQATLSGGEPAARPGTILSADPLEVACGQGSIVVDYGQSEDGVYCTGRQLAEELGLRPGMVCGPHVATESVAERKKRILIFGVNGFIGTHLSERLLESGRYEIHGMDLSHSRLGTVHGHPDFHFREGDIAIHREWIEYNVRKCDIILPLVAIATPKEYVRNPLRVFELDFEENLRIVRYCAEYCKRIIFPSTSEVYGMCPDEQFDETNSNLVVGPINKERWIYSTSKQLLDRVIWAYGRHRGLQFTLFRPFNWIGPRLDSLESARLGSSRAITQLILHLTRGYPIDLVDGGRQRRCFTDVREGIECLFRIIENPDGVCNGEIINIGNPDNEISIKDLAELLVEEFEKHPLRDLFPPFAGFRTIESGVFYGRGYEDVQHRRPSIRRARRLLGWKPQVGIRESVRRTLDFFLQEAAKSPGQPVG